jgi:hypothetical protein
MIMPHKAPSGSWAQETGRRRSMRVLLSVPVVLSGTGADGKKFEEETRTLVVNAHGALIAITTALRADQKITVTHKITKKTQECRVVYTGNVQAGKTQMGLEFVKASPTFWQIDFPPDDWVLPENET